MTETASGERFRIVVPPEAEGERLDRFLLTRFAGRTRTTVSRWIRAGQVLVDDLPASKSGTPLKRGMSLTVFVPAPPPDGLVPEQIAFDLLHEDDDLLVVNKPAGVAVHPGHGLRRGTLVNGLVARGFSLSSIGAPDRPGIVHRLDRGTSGLLIVAKNDRAHLRLAEAFAARRVDKSYRALVWGHPRPAAGRIERSIGRSRNRPTRMAVRDTRGKRRSAVTSYRTLRTLPGFTYLELRLETGRTHQIRVHLQSIGHSIVGDDQYGGRAWRGVQDPRKRKALRLFDRLALHAHRLRLDHPTDGTPLELVAPEPQEILELLSTLGDEP